jgi:hypothetical protein
LRLGLSQPRISKLLADPDWSFGGPPWTEQTAKQIEAFLKERRAANNATAAEMEAEDPDAAIRALSKNPEKIARVKLIVERTAKIKLERELLAGGYIKKEDAEKESIARVFSVRAKLQEIPLRASLIAHKSEAECERILSDWAREICDYYANGGN